MKAAMKIHHVLVFIFSLTKSKCEDCECGWSVKTKIVDGAEAGLLEFPSMAGIVAVDDPQNPCTDKCKNDEGVEQGQIYCGATIISHSYVISTATCVNVFKPPGKLMVVVGQQSTDLAQRSNYTQHIMVHSWKIFKVQNMQYFTLLKLDRPIVWSLGVGPICLPYLFRDADFVDQKLTMVGWGTTGPSEGRSSVLLKTEVPVISIQDCMKMSSNVTNYEICTYAKGKGACVLDTGGPVIYQKLHQFLIGLIGYRHECGEVNKPGVNVKVSSFIQWIENNVDEQLCSLDV